MKTFGILFIILGMLLTFLGFISHASDIQLIIAFVGIAIAGIGGIMIYLAGIKQDLFSLYQWVKKDKD